MAKQTKAHINLKAPGQYDFLTSVAFEHDQSECLRLSEIRVRHTNGEKPFKLPLNLLTWYTEHAPAGREITRDDNNQQNHANLFVDLASLQDQLETFSLKAPFLLEIDISEVDRNDDALVRKDNGLLDVAVYLYHGPKSKCALTLSHLGQTSAEKAAKPTYLFPGHCGPDGRFDLADCVLKSNEGPLDPRSDKRVLIANLTLDAPYQDLRPKLVKHIKLYKDQESEPSNYIRDIHQYEERYQTYPWDQKMPFPDGGQLFGPLLPQSPKEKARALTVSLAAPTTDPLWQEIKTSQQNNGGKPITGQLDLILPEPEENVIASLPLRLSMDKHPWLIITNAQALSAPVLIPLDKEETKQDLTLSLPAPVIPFASQLLSIQFYDTQTQSDQGQQALTVAFNPQTKANNTHVIKPEVLELTDQARQMVLLNPVPGAKQKTKAGTKLKLKCVWPESQKSIIHTLTINWPKTDQANGFAVDIGSKAIAMAKQNDGQISPIKLGAHAPRHFISAYCLPSSVALSTSINKQDGQNPTLKDENWHAQTYPLSLSYTIPEPPTPFEHRLTALQRHYDIALPGKEESNDDQANLKRLFTSNKAQNTLPKDEYYIAQTQSKDNQSAQETGLVKTLAPSQLMADCLSELINFYGTYLPRIHTQEQATVEEKNAAATVREEGTLMVLTHPDHFTDTAKFNYRHAGTKALAQYDLGSFHTLGEMAELLGLKSKHQIGNNVHLISEGTSGAYQALLQLAEQDQPARPKRIEQIHLDIGSQTASISALSGWIGEINAFLERHYGAITLALGGQTLTKALANEVAQILEEAMNGGAPITLEAPLPLSQDQFKAAQNPQNEAEQLQFQFIKSLNAALLESSEQKDNDLQICLAKSKDGNWLFSLASTIAIDNAPITLWQGLRDEKIILTSNEEKTEWEMTLHCSCQKMSEKVGPLSTYLAFLTQFLPNIIHNCFPENSNVDERLISISGGTALFKPIQTEIAKTAQKLKCNFLPAPKNYEQAKCAVAQGALNLVANQSIPPVRITNPSLLLIPLSQDATAHNDLVSMSQIKNTALIANNRAHGPIPKGCHSLQVVETIPGLAYLIVHNPQTISCRPYLEDLDTANKTQWAMAESQWQFWLKDCAQTMLNMAVPSKDQPNQLEWRYQSLQENEAQLTIAEHTYWISSGLTISD